MLFKKLFTALFVIGVVLSMTVAAQAHSWFDVSSGDWGTAANWTDDAEPTASDYASIGSLEPGYIYNPATCYVTQSGEVATGVTVGHGGTGTLYITGGTLTMANDYRIGRIQFDWGDATGTVYQSGGEVSQTSTLSARMTALGWGNGDAGYYNMSGGSLDVKGGRGLVVGICGYGEFNLSETGAVTVNKNLWVAGDVIGYLPPSGYDYGTTAESEGYVNQSGGSMTISDHLYVGYKGVGEYNISGGSLSVDDYVYIGTSTGTGKFEVEDVTAMISWNGSATIGANGTLSYVASAGGVSDIALDYAAGTLTINAAAALSFDLSAMSSAVNDILLIDNYGADAISGTFASYGEGDTVHTFGDGSYYTLTYVYDAGTDVSAANDMALVANPIPEPSTLALLAAGLIGLLAYAWRKRK
ncbi:MAG: PEP-CTERM sorting domain-containing protein [Pirellulales bacterium]|nr:PEP-CTERM sorting domain-containing protein [Pirellulales bacterium]